MNRDSFTCRILVEPTTLLFKALQLMYIASVALYINISLPVSVSVTFQQRVNTVVDQSLRKLRRGISTISLSFL